MISRVGVTLLKCAARSIYAPLKLLPVQHKLVLISRLNSTPSIDFQQIIAEANTQYPTLRVVTLNHKMDNRALHVLDIVKEMYHLATAKACVVESYVISVSILTHRKSLIIIQMWHALGAIKAFGHAAIGKAEGNSKGIAELMHMHRGYTYVTAGSQKTIPIFAKAFNVAESVILPIGMPRTDFLLNTTNQQNSRSKFFTQHKLSADKKVILYAPTFRKKTPIPYDELIAAIDFKNYILVIKQHPHDKTIIDRREGVVITDTFSVLELLPAADYVITDYSAVAFEAALLQKPLFFWSFDIERYGKRRGFALDYDNELPGVKSTSAVEIMTAITTNNFDPQKITDFANAYTTVRDGSCTTKLLQALELQR